MGVRSLMKNVEIIKTHAFNERMYGELQNLSKSRMSKLLGSKKVHALRRSFSTRPKPLNRRSRLHPRNMKIYNKIPRSQIAIIVNRRYARYHL